MTGRSCFMAAMIGLLAAGEALSLTISSNEPGNIFVADSPIEFSVAGAKDVVNYDLNDFDDARIEAGHVRVKDNATVTVKIPGLRPGWYEFRCEDGTGAAAAASVGIVINRAGKPLPADGRIAMDTIGAGGEMANLVRLAGIPWIRERLWWNLVQPSADKMDWTPFTKPAETVSNEGIRILQVWHDSPPWLHPKAPTEVVPDDLRDVYRFSRAAAKQFAGEYQAWEMGNEPDAGWAGKGDRFAGYEKAAYLGLKDGNPECIVLLASVCRGLTPWLRNIFESGAAEYSDAFSWHFYGEPEQYDWSMRAYLGFLKEFDADTRPLWTTEGGVPKGAGHGPDKQEMNPADQRKACRTMVRNVVMALAAGSDRYFYFCLPNYVKRGLQFGLLRADHTPYPGYVAYSAAANILGISDYLGEFPTKDPQVAAYVFATPKGNVLVAWSDRQTEIRIPSDSPEVRVANVFGDERETAVQNGKVRVRVGPDATYVINVGNAIKRELLGTPRPRGKLPANKPSRIVLVGHCGLSTDLDRSCYRVDNATFDFTVDVYNFHEKDNVSGIVQVVAPEGWQVEEPRRDATLGPMGREVMTFKVTPVSAATLGQLNARVTVTGTFGADKVAPSVSYFGFDPATLTVVERKPLDWGKAGRWASNTNCFGGTCTSHVFMAAKQSGPNAVAFASDPKKATNAYPDRFAYAIINFEEPLDLSEYDGIAFTVKGEPATDCVRLMLVEPNGAQYYATVACPGGVKRRAVCVFRDMPWAPWFTTDPNFRFDVNEIAGARLGREGETIAFEAGDFELVKFKK